MKLSAILAPLLAAGVPGDVILATVRAFEEQQSDALARRRENDRIRQQRRRSHVTSRDVTVKERDIASSSPVPLSSPPTPPPIIPQTPSPSHSSLRSENTRAGNPDFKTEFDREFWPIYPNKVGKPVALKAFVKARSQADLQTIIAGLRRYVAKTDDRAWCNPSTWLNQERWNDQPAAAPAARQQSPPRERTILDVLNERIERADNERLQPATIDGEYQTGPRPSADLRFLADAARRRG